MTCAFAVIGAPREGSAQDRSTPPAVRLQLRLRANQVWVAERGSRYADILQSTVDADLERAVGWTGASAHLDLLHSYSTSPNDLARTLQGIVLDDVETRHIRIYQAWMERRLADGRASLRLGIYDPKLEFGVIDSEESLINPSFSVAPELAGSGPRGAPVFPSTSLGARLRLGYGANGYLQLAALDALAGTVGDFAGLDASFGRGALLITEAGAGTERGRLAFGAWRYTRPVPDLRDRRTGGVPAPRAARGAYALAERTFGAEPGEGRQAVLFTRVGVSDGDTSPYAGSWQAGLRLRGVFDGRPGSTLALGATQALMSGKFVRNAVQRRRPVSPMETVFEISYSDQLLRGLRLQPDLQWVLHPAGGATSRDACVFTLRATLDL